MRPSLTPLSARLTMVVLALACAATLVPLRAQAPRERTMYVSAVDANGEPISGLNTDDFVVREDGTAREVLRVSRAIDPIDLAILVDNSAASDGAMPRIREGLTAFIQAMVKGNQIALIGLADRPTIFTDYTQSLESLRNGIGLLWPRSQAASTLLDAVYEVSRGLAKREAPRAIMVLVVIDGADVANRQFTQVAPEVRQASVAIHAVTIGNFASTNDDEFRNRGRLLSETTRVSGGQRINLLTPISVQPTLERLARELSSQYKVVYGRPDSLIPPEKIEVSGRRPEVTMRGTLERATGSAR